MRISMAMALAAVLLTGGCSKRQGGAAAGGTAGHVDGTPHTDAVIDGWKSAGLATEGFAAVQPVPYGASYCEQGRVQGLDALICEFAQDAALNQGDHLLRQEWERQGVHTGVSLRTQRTLLAVVDRGLHDPNGKTIRQLVQVFRKL